MKDKKEASETDAFWDLDALMPPRRAKSPFARDTETVAVQVHGGDEADKGASRIPPPDPERLARAQKALVDAEEKLRLTREKLAQTRTQAKKAAEKARRAGVSIDVEPFGQAAASDLDAAYQAIEEKRRGMERRYRAVTEASEPPPEPPVPPAPPAREILIPKRRVVVAQPDVFVFPTSPLLLKVELYPPSGIERNTPARDACWLASLKAPSEKPREAPYVTAFPHPRELSDEQQEWYLWWREQVKNGNYLPTAAAYIMLYGIECINSIPSGRTTPEGVLETLISLFTHLYEVDVRLHYLFPEWIMDLCLVYRLPFDPARLGDTLPTAIRCASLKEFYLSSAADEKGSAYAHAVFRYAPHIRFAESKYITDENRELFFEHVPNAFYAAFSTIEKEDAGTPNLGTCSRKGLEAIMTRRTFAGSIFVSSLQRTTNVIYLSCSRSIELRFMATDLVKYAENQVRKLLGIKNRYHVAAIDPRLKAAVDAYFAPLFPKPKPKAPSAEEKPAWEALYEPRTTAFSPEEAKRLGDAGWEVTRTLVTAFEGEMEEEEEAPKPPRKPITAPVPAPLVASTEKPSDDRRDTLVITALRTLLARDEGAFRLVAKEAKLLPLTLAERINEAAMDEIGDIVVEEKDGRFVLIQDYLKEIEAWIK